jgi:hypothetical protein
MAVATDHVDLRNEELHRGTKPDENGFLLGIASCFDGDLMDIPSNRRLNGFEWWVLMDLPSGKRGKLENQ